MIPWNQRKSLTASKIPKNKNKNTTPAENMLQGKSAAKKREL
jgi:hypothetical protein